MNRKNKKVLVKNQKLELKKLTTHAFSRQNLSLSLKFLINFKLKSEFRINFNENSSSFCLKFDHFTKIRAI